MNGIKRILGVLKYIAIFIGIDYLLGNLVWRLFAMSYEQWLSIEYPLKFVALIITLAIYRIEREELVIREKSKKSKFFKILLILLTLGVILYLYKKKKGVYVNGNQGSRNTL